MNTQKQHKKQYDWLKGYQFVKGQSGNPGGRPKGSKSLKTFVKEYLENLPEDEKIEYLKSLPEELVWQMAEGRPSQEATVSGTVNLITPEEEQKAIKEYDKYREAKRNNPE